MYVYANAFVCMSSCRLYAHVVSSVCVLLIRRYTFVCICIGVCVCIHACIHACMNACMHMCVGIYVYYTYMHVCIHTQQYICIHVHTYIEDIRVQTTQDPNKRVHLCVCIYGCIYV